MTDVEEVTISPGPGKSICITINGEIDLLFSEAGIAVLSARLAILTSYIVTDKQKCWGMSAAVHGDGLGGRSCSDCGEPIAWRRAVMVKNAYRCTPCQSEVEAS